MKTILFLLLLSPLAHSKPNICVDATTVPAAFTDANADVLTGIRPETQNFQVHNKSDADMCFCWGTAAANCPAIGMMCLPPQAAFSRDGEAAGSTIYAHHDGGAATTGKICSGAW